MAKFISTLFSSIRGSVAGTTYFTTPSGQIIGRQRTKPAKPYTTVQAWIKASMSTMAVAWKDLTQPQRDDWDSWAAGHGSQSGRHRMMGACGLATYMQNFLTTTFDVVLTYPNNKYTPAVSAAVEILVTPPETPFVSVVITNAVATKLHVLAEISYPQDQSRKRYNGPWDTGKTKCLALTATGTAVCTFDDLQEGSLYFIKIRPVTTDDANEGHIVGPTFHMVAPAITPAP